MRIGAFDSGERSRVLDTLGFDAQLVFPTFAGSQFESARPRPAVRRHRRAQPGDGRVLRRRSAAAARRRDPVGLTGANDRGRPPRDRRGRGRDPGVQRAPEGSRLADPSRSSSAVGAPRGVRRAGAHPRRRRRQSGAGRLPRQRHAASPTSSAAARTSAPRTSSPSTSAPRCSGGRWCSTASSSASRDLRGASIEEGALWVIPWLMRLDAAPKAFRKTEPFLTRRCHSRRASTCTGSCASRRSPPRPPAGSSSRAATTCSCSAATTRIPKAPATRSPASSRRWPRSTRRRGSGSTARNFAELFHRRTLAGV